MCGIAGYLSQDGRFSGRRGNSLLTAMADILASRGPDASGIYQTDTLGFAHRRLSVIELSEKSNQPMHYADGRYTITFNGEIYNYRELRAELVAKGAAFKTESDTEVILAGFAIWGDRFVDRLRGMFAFALFDHREQSLFLARDALGEKPLYIAQIGDGLVFASEIKALLCCADVPRDIDTNQIDRYLAFQYVPGPRTIFSAVRQVPAATVLRVGPDGAIHSHRYWTPTPVEKQRDRPLPDLVAETRARFDEAIVRQTVSDVQIGVLLSGGIDSGAIVGALAAAGKGPIKTFTVGFRESEIDERRAARETADMFGTTHSETVISDGVSELVELIAGRFDQPFADPAAIPLYALTQMMRDSVKVALAGDGGDETMLGYSRYIGMKLSSRSEHIPAPISSFLRRLAMRAPVEESPFRLVRYARRLFIELGKPEEERYADWICVFSDRDKDSLFTEDAFSSQRESIYELVGNQLARPGSPEERAALVDIGHYLPDDLLTKTDTMSMSHGLEVRCPLLDRDLVDFCLSIPAKRRMPLLETKWLMRAAYDSVLPERTLSLPKRGLSIPLTNWMRGPLRPMIEDCLSPESLKNRGLFRPEAVESMLQSLFEGSSACQYRLWLLLCLELWYRNWVDNPPRAI